MSSKNNFTKDEVKQKSKYKLWILYKPEYAAKFGSNPFTYFSYHTKSDGGLAGLQALAEKRKGMFLLAVLYDNQSADRDNNEIQRWDGGSPLKPVERMVGNLKRKRPRIYRPINKRTW